MKVDAAAMPKPRILKSSQSTLSLRIEDPPEVVDDPTERQRVSWRRRGWSLLWALVIHASLLLLVSLLYVAPKLIAQIGNSVTMSTEPAVDRQQETQEEPTEEVIISSSEAPPPKPSEAAIPELLPITLPVDIPLPPPTEAMESMEMDAEIVDLGTTFGEGLDGEEPEEEVLETKMFSAPAKGDCTIFVIDVSTSMPRELGMDGIATMRRDLRLTIDALPIEQLFNVICFGDKADGFAVGPVRASLEHKALAHRFMADYFTGRFTRTRTERFGRAGLARGIPYIPIEPKEVLYMKKTRGGSRYDLALVAAFQQRASTIYLVTDGTPSVARDRGFLPGAVNVPRAEIMRTVVKAGRRLYPEALPLVNCVGVNGIGAQYLKQISLAFGGQFRNVQVANKKSPSPN